MWSQSSLVLALVLVQQQCEALLCALSAGKIHREQSRDVYWDAGCWVTSIVGSLQCAIANVNFSLGSWLIFDKLLSTSLTSPLMLSCSVQRAVEQADRIYGSRIQSQFLLFTRFSQTNGPKKIKKINSLLFLLFFHPTIFVAVLFSLQIERIESWMTGNGSWTVRGRLIVTGMD